METELFLKELEKSKPQVLGYAFNLTKNKEKALELYQEAVLRACNNSDSFILGTNFTAWMCVIIRNLYLNMLDKEKHFVASDLENHSDSFYSHCDEDMCTKEIVACVDRLPAVRGISIMPAILNTSTASVMTLPLKQWTAVPTRTSIPLHLSALVWTTMQI